MASSINASTSAGVVTTADTSGVLNIQTAGTTAISIDASQAVSFTNQPTYSSGTANGVAYLNGSKVLTTGSALVFDGTNLGIGTSSPAYKLQVANNGNFNTTVNVSNTTAGTSSYARFLSISDGGNASFGMTSTTYTDVTSAADSLLINASGASGGIVFAHDGVSKMLLDSSGNTGIGTTSTTAVRLIVKGSTSNGTSNAFKLIDSADADILAMSTAGDFYLPKMGSSTGTTVVLTSGNYLVKSSSSIRYKKDVEPIDIGLNFVLGLSPVKYKMKLDDANQVGFIAEDFPDERLVSFSLVNPQDKQSELQRESVNYANLVAPLVKAIQEQQAIIQSLTDRITALENK